MKIALLWRQCGLWVLTRLVFGFVLALAAAGPSEIATASNAWHAQPAVILICVALGAVEMLRRGERLLLGNLGVGRRHLAAVLAGPPVVAEALVAIAGSL